MSFIIDTCVVSELAKPDPAPQVVSWFNECPSELLYLSVLTLGELHYGVARLPEGSRKNDLVLWLQQLESAYADDILPVNDRICVRWGRERARLEQVGRPVPVVDSLLAATALEHGFVLVTRNVDDFRAFGIQLLDPWSHESP